MLHLLHIFIGKVFHILETEKFCFISMPVTYKSFSNPDDINLKMASEHQTGQTQNGNPFRGMGKEELLRHSSKPLWVRLRMICVAIILIAWLALIITVVALIFAYPKCKDKDSRSWWQNDVMYRIHVRSFYDSNDDGIGDLKGKLLKKY